MRKEKITEILRQEFGRDIIVFDNGFELHVFCYLNDYAIVVFETTRGYVVWATITENRSLMLMSSLPYIKLETEDQVIQLVQYGCRYLREEYKEVY